MAKNEEVKQPTSGKPPTQGIGVQGFKADLYASDIPRIDWHRLTNIPKFQMYATEHAGKTYGDVSNVMEWIVGYVQDQIHAGNEQQLFDAYTKWHDEKGYWNNETVYGVLVEGE